MATTAQPAQPVLAFNIWLSQSSNTTEPSPRLSFANKGLDAVYGGGLEYGAVHCFTAEPDTGVSEIIQTKLASHLQSTAASEGSATLIDSTLSFDLRRLFKILEGNQAAAALGRSGKEEATRMLHRLKISKVFDFVGLTEAVSEAREGMEGEMKGEVGEAQGKAFPSTIQDSQEDEDEMLDDLPAAGGKGDEKPPAPAAGPTDTTNQPTRRLLIINDLSQLLMPETRNSWSRGQALLSSFMRSLDHLSRNHNVCTLVICSPSKKPADHFEQRSIFKSCKLKPALGREIGHLVDTHSYVHQMPVGRNSHDQMARVLEIVQDRNGDREGKWAPFECDADGRIVG